LKYEAPLTSEEKAFLCSAPNRGEPSGGGGGIKSEEDWLGGAGGHRTGHGSRGRGGDGEGAAPPGAGAGAGGVPETRRFAWNTADFSLDPDTMELQIGAQVVEPRQSELNQRSRNENTENPGPATTTTERKKRRLRTRTCSVVDCNEDVPDRVRGKGETRGWTPRTPQKKHTENLTLWRKIGCERGGETKNQRTECPNPTFYPSGPHEAPGFNVISYVIRRCLYSQRRSLSASAIAVSKTGWGCTASSLFALLQSENKCV